MAPEHVDVLVVGAGLSGIGAGYRLQTECPTKSYAILEGRPAMGGTWDLFRYPGIRSDSDMYTLGYPFQPWTEAQSIADGPSILKYIHDTAEQHGIDRHVRYDHHVDSASWSSEEALWTVSATVLDQTRTFTCNFLYACSGYYSYDAGYAPSFPGVESFEGEVIHPQRWPEDLDYQGKNVVVIGSGATAVTLVPAMADKVEHITMLQRSPSYVTALPAKDVVADKLREHLPEKAAHSMVRWKNVTVTTAFYQLCRRAPETATKLLKAGVRRAVGDSVELDPHFTPNYNPWDQRLCMVPDGDLFEVLKSGKASIVTDRIETFTPTGIELESGEHLAADIVITATGLQMVAAGEIDLTVDGVSQIPGEGVVYRGLMSSGIPNFGWCVGYTNASWTLRADLSSRYVCRFLTYLDEHHYDYGVPHIDDPTMPRRPILDLSSGYMQRAIDLLPKQGTKAPWLLRQNYFLDTASMRLGKIDRDMRFGRKKRTPVKAGVSSARVG